MSIRIIRANLKVFRDWINPYRCDRSSPLGNQYRIDESHTRDNVCDSHQEYLKHAAEHDPDVKAALDEIKAKAIETGCVTLLCHCKPKRCHIDNVAVKLRDDLLEEGYDAEVI